MESQEKPDVLAARVGAAACGAWCALALGIVLVMFMGVAYLFVVHTPLIHGVAVVWGTGPNVVRILFVVSIAVLKMFLTFWALGCVFLSVWSRRLGGRCCG